MNRSHSRRAFLSVATATVATMRAQTGAPTPPEIRRYRDPATELPVTRLTSPAYTSLLPAWYQTAMTRRGHVLFYSSERSGSVQAWRLDMKSGENRQLTTEEPIHPGSLALMPDERHLAFIAGRALHLCQILGRRNRVIYRVPDAFEPAPGFGITDDGAVVIIVEKGASSWRLRAVRISDGSAATVLESADEISDPAPRPRSRQVAYRAGRDVVRIVSLDGARVRALERPDEIGQFFWSPEGAALLYLSFPADPGQLHTIRELRIQTGQDTLVAKTSQFASFGRNADASVFAGASGSKASPNVLLMVRSVRRELSLCEHRASNPALVSPRFSPDSQRVLFQSDRDGKMAIYSVNVEKLVEETES